MFIAMKEGIGVAFAYKHPRNVAIYAYNYSKWCYYNPDLITYSIIFKICVSLFVPFWLYLKISKMNLKNVSKSLRKSTSSMFKKDNNDTKNLQNSVDNNSVKQGDYREEIYNIKRDAMINIEKSINKMVSEILYVKNKVIRENSSNVNNVNVNNDKTN